MMWAYVAPAAAAAPGEIEVTRGGVRATDDLSVTVGADGAVLVNGVRATDAGVPGLVRNALKTLGPNARVVVSSEPGVPYSRVMGVLDLVQFAGASRVALEIGAPVPGADPLSPVGQDVANLDTQEFGELFEEYKPHHHEYPQNPYSSTDFTAYTRELGEWKVGLASLSFGVLPRLHVGTSPVLDGVGLFNGFAKWNFLRTKRVDLSLGGSLYVVPITQLLQTIDSDGQYEIAGQQVDQDQVFVDRITTSSLSIGSSVQVWKGWSLHGGVGWTRATAVGSLDFNDLPVVLIPGLDPVGGAITIVPRVTGTLFDVRLATDLRFNRRDSLILQSAATVYGYASGTVSGGIEGLPPEMQDFDFALGYGGGISPAASYRASIAWQFSWTKVDLRFGVGSSAVPGTWALQAFDLAYRFGGATRRTERTIKKGYREDKKTIRSMEGEESALPPDAPQPTEPPKGGG